MATNQATTEGYREMLVLDLIEQYDPVYPEGGDWIETTRFLYETEPEHMAKLTASLAAQGWRDPIMLSDEEDLEEGDSPLVFNGTHRVAIALREGVVSVPVATGNELRKKPYPEHFTVLTVELSSGELSEDEDLEIFDLLRSFELTDDIWLNSDVCFGSQHRWEFYYDFLDDSAHFPRLKRLVKRRLKAAFGDRVFDVAMKLEVHGEDPEEENG